MSGHPAARCGPRVRRDVTMRMPTFSVEVITLPVSNVERTLRFYVDQVGFTLDVDYSPHDAFRVVQLTPPGSSCSIQIGNGLTDAPVGSLRNVYPSSRTSRRRAAACSNVGSTSVRSGTRRQLEPGMEVSRRARPRARRLCQLHQLLRSGWQQLGTTGTGLPQCVM